MTSLKSIFFIFWALLVKNVCAQTEPTLFFMNSLPQVVYTNPASVPAYKFTLGLPGSSVYAQYSNSGFNYKNVIVSQGDSSIIDLNKFTGSLKKKNYITTAFQADILRFGFKVNARMYFSYHLGVKSYTRMMLPKGLFSLLTEGTGALVSETTSISPLIENVQYLESSWGASYIVNRKLTVGTNIKLLKGITNATTANSTVDISVDNEYQIGIRADINAKTSGINNFDDDDYELEDNYKDFFKNNGFAIDLGAFYKLNERINVGISLIDIGFINWKNDLYGYNLNPEKANFIFKGINLQRVLDNEGDYLDSELDSLEDNFEFDEGVIGKYKTPIPGKIYLSGTYKLSRTVSAGALFFTEKFRNRFSASISTSIHKEFGTKFSASISYTATQHSYNNIGAGVSLNLSPIQFYIVGDNLLRAPFSYLANNDLNSFANSTKYFNVRTGLNFVFGRIKSQEKLPNPQK
jgi:hypothetical protein